MMLWLGLLIGCFYIPPKALSNEYWITAIFFSVFFIVMQAILLVNFAHDWAENWLARIELADDSPYKFLLIGTTFILYGASLSMTIILYIFYNDTKLDTFLITFNLLISVAQSAVSILPKVQEYNSNSGLLQSSVLTVYNTYLTFSAVALAISSKGQASTTVAVVGIILTFLSLTYAAYSTGSGSVKLGVTDKNEDVVIEEEEAGNDYSFSLFHFCFFAASFYMAMVLSSWVEPTLDTATGEVFLADKNGPLWTKVSSSWFVSLLYIWTLIAPVLFPNRDFSV